VTTYIEWKDGFRDGAKVDALVAWREVNRLKEKHGGELTADQFVAAAKAKRSPLHELLNWDDSQAAHEHRLAQARGVLRAFVIVRPAVDRPDIKTRAFTVVTRPPIEEGEKARKVYRSIEDALADPEERAEILLRAVRELLAVRRRYQALTELDSIFQAIDRVAAQAPN